VLIWIKAIAVRTQILTPPSDCSKSEEKWCRITWRMSMMKYSKEDRESQKLTDHKKGATRESLRN